MDVVRIVYSFASVAGIGLVLGIGLAIAGRLLTIARNERLESIEAALPGLNCGACGFAGCSSYAEAIAAGEENLTLCSPGGPEAAQELSRIMGVEVQADARKMVAQVHCRGGKDSAAFAFEYEGIRDCNALYALSGGNKVCKYGCLGLGTCMTVCPVDAIFYDDGGLVVVDREKCISCSKCVDVCPTGVMQMIPYDADYIVACNSHDKGPVTKRACTVGCIGCKICSKQSPEGGFAIEDFLAHIDYDAGGSREEAAEKCPPKCIIKIPT